jgi:hypothetical protein
MTEPVTIQPAAYRTFRGGTPDLLSTFRAVESSTVFGWTHMPSAQRAALLTELGEWSVRRSDDFDWDAVEGMNPTAVDDSVP